MWVDHFREPNHILAQELEAGTVCIHPYVIGELACGNLSNRAATIAALKDLPSPVIATSEEVLEFIEVHRLMGRGIGYVDVHLLAATVLSGAYLWTRDRRLREAAIDLQLAVDV